MDITEIMKIDKNNIENSFYEIAKMLLNGFNIIANNIEYELIEVECYFKSDCHNDTKTLKGEIRPVIFSFMIMVLIYVSNQMWKVNMGAF